MRGREIKRTFGPLALITGMLGIAGTILVIPLQAQNSDGSLENLRELAPRVFIDCNSCDRNYFREEITYVNYVRDRADADVHVLITEQGTGSGGREYTFAFIGLGDFAGIDNTLVCAAGPNDTLDEVRAIHAGILEKGLFPYCLRTPVAEYIDLAFRQKLEPTAVRDPWKFWVFSVSADARLRGEESQTSKSLDMNLSANRVTPEWKLRLGVSVESDKEAYDYEGETITSISKEKNFTGMLVKSLGDHWSLGGWVEAESSTYSNIDSYITVAPALEYNVFRYSESTRRQLRFLYRIGWNQADYIEETIYAKTQETLFNQSLRATMDVQEPWGSISASVEGSHYLHDFKKARLELRSYLSFRVFKGLSVDVNGRYDIIHDQLSLPAGDLTIDEILLRRKELATGYDYSISFGFRYTFGSVFSNVVNPRFGGTRRYGH